MPATGQTPPALVLEGLQKRFGLGRRARAVLRGVDLCLARGRSLGLVGPNGAGKTTLLRIVAGVEPASSQGASVVSVLGRTPRDPAARRAVGYVPEGAPFPRELGAARALDLLGALAGMPRAERRRRAGAMLERVGLGGVTGLALGRLSQGMLRRFALAQAFLHEPELLLLDEPSSGLDAEGYVVLEELLAEARGRGATLVLASHVFSEVLEGCHELAVLFDGRVAWSGPPAELLAAHGSLVRLYRALGPQAGRGRA